MADLVQRKAGSVGGCAAAAARRGANHSGPSRLKTQLYTLQAHQILKHHVVLCHHLHIQLGLSHQDK